MHQSMSPAPLESAERYGAIATAHGSYTRSIPPMIQQPAFDWYLVTLARFESVDTAVAAVPDINTDGMASLREQWGTVELSETVLPTTLGMASRQLFSGTTGPYFATILVFQVNDIVGVLSGTSNWSPTELATSYLGDIMSSLAAADEGGDLSLLLPPADLLVGGLQVKE